MSLRSKIRVVTPLTCVVIYLFLGFQFGLWLEGALVFLLIPVMPILLGYRKLRLSIPLIITIVYFVLGFGFDAWHPGWLVFLLIPIIQTLIAPSSKTRKTVSFNSESTTILDDEDYS